MRRLRSAATPNRLSRLSSPWKRRRLITLHTRHHGASLAIEPERRGEPRRVAVREVATQPAHGASGRRLCPDTHERGTTRPTMWRGCEPRPRRSRAIAADGDPDAVPAILRAGVGAPVHDDVGVEEHEPAPFRGRSVPQGHPATLGAPFSRELIIVFNISSIVVVARFLLSCFLLSCLLIAASTACTPRSSGSGRPAAVAAFYPLAFAVAEAGGRSIEVVNLTTAGAEPHDLELTPSHVRRLKEAALVVYVGGGFQPAVEKVAADLEGRNLDILAIPEVKRELLEAGDPERPRAVDPHVWLDPRLMAQIAEAVGERLGGVDAGRAADYRMRAERLATRLGELDRAYAAGLAVCARRDLVTSHGAFGYPARRYGLTEVGIAGLSPEAEPSPQRLAEVAAFVRERGVTTIFFETLVSPKLAESLAREAGVRTDVLDPLEGKPEGGDYLHGMSRNLAALRRALGCR